MFSGKTEELMRRLGRAVIAKQQVEVYKPIIDVRYSDTDVVSHQGHSIEATPVESPFSILLYGSEASVIGIDEAQFFDRGLVEVAQLLADEGKRVIIAGLDMDFQRRPFGPMPELMSIADSISKVHAICTECGRPALYSYRLSDNEAQFMLGELGDYRPLCRGCFMHRQSHRNQ